MNLPQPQNVEEFNDINRSNPAFKQFILNNFSQNLPEEINIKAFENGSCPTYSISGKQVAKFFPDLYLEDFKNELTALSFIDSREVGSPKVIAKKSLAGWNVILMEQLPGTTLDELWDELTHDKKCKLAFEAGAHIKRLHSIGNPTESDQRKWESFFDQQREQFFEKQKGLALRNDLLEQLPSFLDSVNLNNNQFVFLHTEAMKDHFMINRIGDEFSLSGLIDFEPAMWGHAEYEFAAVGLFISAGDKQIFKQFLDGYGFEPDSEFHRRIMAYTILHRYANLPWFLSFMPQADSIEELSEKWFGV